MLEEVFATVWVGTKRVGFVVSWASRTGSSVLVSDVYAGTLDDLGAAVGGTGIAGTGSSTIVTVVNRGVGAEEMATGGWL